MSRSDNGILLLAGEGMSTRILYNALADDFQIQAVLIEERESRLKFLRRRVRRLGFWTVVGQLLFLMFIAPSIRRASRERINGILEEADLTDDPVPATVRRDISSVNADSTVRLIEHLEPGVVLINGTRILSSDVIESIHCPILNLHLGITPRYRGIHGGYWARVEENDGCFGATVHLVDEGIDTGAVIEQVTTEPAPGDNYATYPLIQLAAGVPKLKKALRQALDGSLEPSEGKAHPSKLWSHPTLLEYLENRLRLGVP